ncbi:ABC transporter ATP-binding protein [Acidisphaera sp. S103]|uniref:dipeptide ABC transporter ATP-binding protein n=1 Tax=Acidisphaera sp. S103 TaxID=1747223 RepID=UPI00131E01A0|nr:ABC transporter ATP-binding protein [Acidisphaera sp. S103]
MNELETILRVRNLVVGRSDAPTAILKGIGFSLRRGDFLAVVGESGSGKTTLSRAIIGLLAPELRIASGEITFAGADLTRMNERQFTQLRGQDIGFVPQDPGLSLNPTKTIGSQLSEVFRLRTDIALTGAAIQAHCIALLNQVGIDRPEERLRHYPHQLSGGQKQRVLIAIAFACNPHLLIADEPTSALNVTVQRQVMTVFDRLVAERGTTVVFVTHDIALAADHASHILVLRDGRVVEAGPVGEILRNPASSYTRSLLAAQCTATPIISRAPEVAQHDRILEVEDLVMIFGDHAGPPAVDGVSFSVRRGSTFALVGESGSGKSTTARMVLGLERAVSGRIRLNGRDITRPSLAERRRVWREIQFVHQNPDASLNPRETVGGIVGSPLRAHRAGTAAQRAARIAALLEQVGLPSEVTAKRPAELSGGQRQRVAIARALALDARMLILDEALSALDIVTRMQILDLLRRLQQSLGLTLIFISHDLSVVRQFADDVGVMHQGRLVETGSIGTIFDTPATPYTRALLAAQPGHRLASVYQAHGSDLITEPSVYG